MSIKDGFKFGLGLWFSTMLVGTIYIIIITLIMMAIM